MSTCRWCTPGGSFTTDFLKRYSSKSLAPEDLVAADDDLCYCLECVVEYHKARDEQPFLHKDLWELEISRLVAQFEKSIFEENDDVDELLLVEENKETRLSGYTGPDFEYSLRVPLLEILKYPYLLLHERLGELCVLALCKMEQVNYSFQVFDKHPGIYLLLVHPNEMIRRWAILTARSLGKVARDDYYDLQEVFTCLFKVIELGLFENLDIYSFSDIEKGKLILLPSHLYDTSNHKNYWLGICMLLSVLEEQAMDSLLLGPDKQNEFMQSILNTMMKKSDNDSTDPFWPALHCFMVILDQLGSKVWGQLIDPIEAFQTIINSPSYKNEIENIRKSTIKTKSEPELDYNEDDIVTCSQIVYNYNIEKPKKDAGWKSAICPDYCPNMYEEMQTLANVLQSDIGQDMRVHNSTFLWFIPFVQSVMDLKDLGVAYIVEVIHHLHSEIKDVLNRRVELCDQVTEFFILILVSVIELHRNKKCLHLLWVSSQKWVETLVKCAMLPAKDFRRHTEKMPTHCPKITSSTSLTVPMSANSQATSSVQYACVQLIRSLLKEGCQLGQQSTCKKFLDVLNHLLRGSSFQGLILNEQEAHGLESCLKQIIKNTKDRMSVTVSSPVERNSICKFPSTFIKQENLDRDECYMGTPCGNSSSSPLSSEIGTDVGCKRSPSANRNMNFQECLLETCIKDSKLCLETECPIAQGNSGVKTSFEEREVSDNVVAIRRHKDFQNIEQCDVAKQNIIENRSPSDGHFTTSHQESTSTCQSLWEGREKEGTWGRESLSTDPRCNPCAVEWDGESSKPSFPKHVIDSTKLKNLKTKVDMSNWQSRLSVVMDKLKNKRANDSSYQEAENNHSKPVNNSRKDQTSSALYNDKTSEVCTHKNSGNGEKSTNKILSVRLSPIKLESDNLLTFSRSCTKLSETEEISDSEDSVSLAVIRSTLLKKKYSVNSSKLPESLALGLEQTKLENLSSRKDAFKDGTRSICADKVDESASDDSEHIYQKCKNKSLKNSSFSKKCKLDVLSESDDDCSLVKSGSALAKRKGSLIVSSHTLTSSEVDRDLNRLSRIAYAKGMSFPEDSSQETSAFQVLDQVERKVKDSTRPSIGIQSHRSFSEIKAHNEPIIISDSSDEEKIHITVMHIQRKNNKRDCSDEQLSTSCASIGLDVNMKGESSPVPCDEYDSQFFEFETENEIYSVWPDSQNDKKKSVEILKREQEPCSSSAQDCSKESHLDWDAQYNEWGYDTDYISDDLIEQAANNAEEKLAGKGKITMNKMLNETESHLKRDQPKFKTVADAAAESSPNETFPEKHRETTHRLADASELTKEKRKDAIVCPRHKDLLEAKPVRTETLSKSPQKVSKVGRSNKIHFHQANTRKLVSPRTLPAVVPPKKARKCPEPASTVEKLGLKKAPRKAFDLSQRTLDSLAELRSHGQAAGALEIKKRQKINLISPRALSVKGHKNLLACQDLQFYRQTRPKKREKEKNLGEISKNSTKRARSAITEQPHRQELVAHELVQSAGVWEHRTEPTTRELVSNSGNEGKEWRRSTSTQHDMKASNVSKINDDDMAHPTHSVELNINIQEDNKPSISLKDPLLLSLPLHSLHKEETENETEEGNLFLTQQNPVDMELCSQEENTDIKMGTDDPIDLAEVIPRALPSGGSLCKQKDCTQTAELPGIYCCKHSDPGTSDDQHFVRPGLPPSLCKPHRPTTVKIFSTGFSSRNASLTKDFENLSKLPLAIKNKPQAVKPIKPKLNVPEFVLDQNRFAKPKSNQTSIAQRSRTEAENTSPGSEGDQFSLYHRVNPRSSQPWDQAFLIREILQWKHEMFLNFCRIGAPSNLCQFPLTPVPLRFRDYKDYFHIFFPLMMLNTFESLAQEWKEKKKNTPYQLFLCSNMQVNPADYKVFIRDYDLTKQLHPRDDDLIFLWGPEDQNSFSPDQDKLDSLQTYHIGHVSRFSRSTVTEMRSGEQYVSCHLSIQTQGNFSNNSQVNCEVIGSLVTTQRQFKALLNLQWSPLFKPIISLSPAEFFPRDRVNVPTEGHALSYTKEYNEDQKKTIETALAMVRQYPRLPRICLIHGPPGTGKSETIVGLLHRILIEKRSNEMPPQNLNTKNKRNRVLVCAPSNAAIDDLMKKIILAFKSKCHDKKNTLGNCGDINLVRLGSEKTIDKTVVKFSLDSRVSHRMEKAQPCRYQDFQRRKEELDRRLDELSRQRAMERCNKSEKYDNLDKDICKLSRERQQLTYHQKEVCMRPHEIQRTIILESHIICCTLSTSGGVLLESAFRHLGHDPFSCVIVDEAGQACEVETLIPLIHRCAKLILVGDPEQLPPTVISKEAEKLGYGQSLMARLCSSLESEVQRGTVARKPVLQLTVQYRMHPDICLFPSNCFYGKLLKTDKDTEENRCSSGWPFQPYLVFDVSDGYEKRENESYCNPQEVKLTITLIKLIKERKDMKGRSFGVITPYKAQKKMIQRELEREFGLANSDNTWEVDTVDGFQGREKDCVIVTCVRANTLSGSIGFLDSRQRLNVTITRAKFSLFIMGSLKTLMENQAWDKLIQDAQRRGAIVKTQEKNYSKHASKIQKLKPVFQRSLSHPNSAGLASRASHRPQGGTAHSRTSEFLNDLKQLSALPLPPATLQPQLHSSLSSNGGPQPQCLPSAGTSRRVSVQTKAASTPPCVPERPRDPRLARREENAPQESARKMNQASSHQGMAVQQDISGTAAHLSHGTAVQQHSNSEATSFNKLAQTVSPLAMGSSPAPREWNSKNTGGHSASKKPPEQSLDWQDVKKRKLSS